MKIRTDFVTNSSSSSFCCVKFSVKTEDKSFEFSVVPNDEGNILLNKDDVISETLKSSNDVPELCKNLLELIDFQNQFEYYFDWFWEEADEANVSIETVNDLKSNYEKIDCMRKWMPEFSTFYEDLYNAFQAFYDSTKNEIKAIDEVKEIRIREENSENPSADDFYFLNMLGECIIYDNDKKIDIDKTMEAIREKYDEKSDFEGIKKAILTGNCFRYKQENEKIIDTHTGDIKIGKTVLSVN